MLAWPPGDFVEEAGQPLQRDGPSFVAKKVGVDGKSAASLVVGGLPSSAQFLGLEEAGGFGAGRLRSQPQQGRKAKRRRRDKAVLVFEKGAFGADGQLREADARRVSLGPFLRGGSPAARYAAFQQVDACLAGNRPHRHGDGG